jgi:8-oxo-dGTP pyrophosphatase MutT (NUDIX family)
VPAEAPSNVEVRPAATVMLVRDDPSGGADPLQVLMLRRNLDSKFVGGAYVFPGGAVDPADGGPEADAFCAGRSDAEASALMDIDSGGLAYWVAVLRECFEEAGVLLAYKAGTDGSGGPASLSFADPADEARFVAHRAELNDGSRRFLDICAEEQLMLAVDRVHYFAHWVTPLGAPRRYDTRFFVAPAPEDQSPVNDAAETIADEWVSPHEALRRHREGEIDIIFPTIRNLQAIGRFPTSATLLAAAQEHEERVPLVVPRVIADGRGMRIVLPGDPGYEEAKPATAPEDPAAFQQAVRTVSRDANQAPAEGG